jgi:hypothetical protein
MSRFSIGVDLGTTNSVLAFSELEGDPAVQVLPIPQLVAPSTVDPRPVLPSFLYLATDQEKDANAFDLPWASSRSFVVGEYANRQAAQVPARTLSAPKSWLCHNRVDRRQPILPWNAPDELDKVSPVEASQRYLEHLVAAWNEAHPDDPFAKQQVVLAVPASFDAAARDLTREAALGAGFPKDFTLLEEPQAALYAWLGDMGDEWRQELAVGDVLLVCDIGGGTTDFSLIRVVDEEGDLGLERVAVGNHILVGGDNMDLSLAHHATKAFADQGVSVDAWQSVALWHSCRGAKEALLVEGGPATHTVTVPGRGSKLVGGAISVELEAEAAHETLVDGFFPPCKLDDSPERQRGSGFQEVGLPFESDPAITRHLAHFLSSHSEMGGKGEPLRPTHILFNGGCLKADAFKRRLVEVLGSWYEDEAEIRSLPRAEDLDFAVARGAASYGSAKQGRGIRIRGGAGRSYYVGIETAGLAVPGAPRPLKALCVVPFGMEEGTEIDVPGSEIGLVVGEPASFRFFSSGERQEDPPGTVLDSWQEDELIETDALEATLEAEAGIEGGHLPVRFRSRLTELGVFELWCVSSEPAREWKLEFSVRENAG